MVVRLVGKSRSLPCP